MKILIVDDDEIALDILSAALESSGYDVETAGNGIRRARSDRTR